MALFRLTLPGRTVAALVVVTLMAGSASAGSLIGETRYSDSFGNLVIYAPSGYKRIVVGQGHRAYARRSMDHYEEPRTAYLERERGRIYLRERKHCRYGALLKGRSYMYGLPDPVVPVPVAPCR